MTDRGLLDRYVRDGSQAAFAELAERHMRMVYATCRRDLGDAQLAEDAAQAVFILFARKAKEFTRDVSITGWLFTAARLVARNAVRREATRKRHEQEALTDVEVAVHNDESWQGIEPWLNDALQSLQPGDRDAALMRYFDGLSVREMAAQLGIGEDTAGKRIARAVDRMRRFLRGKEVPVTALVLAALLTDRATADVPSTLAASVALAPGLPLPQIAQIPDIPHSLTHAGATGSKGATKLMNTKLTAAVCGAALILSTVAFLVRAHLRAEAASPGPPVLLRYKLNPGQTQVYRITLDENGSVALSTGTVPVHQQVSMVMHERIDSVAPDGTGKGTMQTTSMSILMNGQPLSLPPSTAAGYSKPQAITVSPTGHMTADAPPPTDTTGPGMFSSSEFSAELPDKPLTSGETWTTTANLPAMGIHMTIPCVLANVSNRGGHQVALINETFNSAVTPGSVGTPMNGTMKGTGTVLFDADLGIPVDQQNNLKIDSMANIAPPGQPAQMGHLIMDISMHEVYDPSAT